MSESNNDNNGLANELALLHAKLDDLTAKQATVHLRFGAVLIFVLLLVAGVYFGYRQIIQWRAELQKAEQVEVLWKADEQRIADLQKQNDAANKADTEHEQSISKGVASRDKVANKSISDVTTRPRPVEQIVSDVKQYLRTNPIVTAQNRLAFDPPVVQGFVATQIDHDRLLQNLNDTQGLYTLERQKSARLTTDNKNLGEMLNECSDTVAAYKNVAKKSGWHKFLSGAGKGLEIAGGIVAGYGIGHVL